MEKKSWEIKHIDNGILDDSFPLTYTLISKIKFFYRTSLVITLDFSSDSQFSNLPHRIDIIITSSFMLLVITMNSQD